MADKTPATAPADTQPIGTPPAGGRWTWSGGQWVQIPESDEPAAPAPAGPPAATNAAPKE